jgi:hypothetical protein
MTPAEFDDIRFQKYIANLTPKNLDIYIREKGGIQSLSAGTLEVFIRKKGGYVGLNCDELHEVVLRDRVLHPEKIKAFDQARANRIKREKLNAMKLWSRQQATDYIHAKPSGEKFDCDELNILNDILEPKPDPAPLTASKKKLLQEKFVKFVPGKQRWPNVDFSLWNEEQLDAYTNSFDLTFVETEYIFQRQTEIKQLQCIDQWDYDKAMLFITNLLNKDSVNRDQWRKISCKINLTVIEIKKMIKPISRADYQELLEQHNKELAETEACNKVQKENLALDDTAA